MPWAGLTQRIHFSTTMKGQVMARNQKYSAVIVFGLALATASPALAHEAWSPDSGSHVWSNTPYNDRFSVEDNKCDTYSAYGYWNNTNNRLDNKNGCNTTIKKYSVNVTAVQACTNIPLASDPCSSWR